MLSACRCTENVNHWQKLFRGARAVVNFFEPSKKSTDMVLAADVYRALRGKGIGRITKPVREAICQDLKRIFGDSKAFTTIAGKKGSSGVNYVWPKPQKWGCNRWKP
jgi:hypothetical protein